LVTTAIPAGQRIYNGASALNSPTTTVFDAEVNNAFFLADWLRWAADPRANNGWRDPCQLTGAASGFLWRGGRFNGNIPRTRHRTGPTGFYTSGTPQRFNSTLWFPQVSVPGTIRGAQFGILDDLDSGFVDGIRAVQMNAALTVDRCIFSCARDDAIEADGTSAPLTITNSFFEHVYSWVSATGNGSTMTGKQIVISDTLCRFRAWPEQGTSSQIGPVFKVDGAGNAPVFRMTNVTLHIPNSWPESGYNRTRGALSRMVCNNCTLLVTGGVLSSDFGLRAAFVGAGWTLVENTAEANSIWATRKAAFLSAGSNPPPPPPPAPSLTSPVTFNAQVG
jgi:hypothetical protein